MTGKIQIINDEGQLINKARGHIAYDFTLTSNNSPYVLDIKTDLTRDAVGGWLITRDEDVLVEISNNGTDYGTQYTLPQGVPENFQGERLSKIKITHTGTDTDVVARFT